MDLSEVLRRFHDQMVDAWLHRMISDRSSGYSEERPGELRVQIERATIAFWLAVVDDQWTELRKFVSFIARRRLQEGFTLSEVQRSCSRLRKSDRPRDARLSEQAPNVSLSDRPALS